MTDAAYELFATITQIRVVFVVAVVAGVLLSTIIPTTDAMMYFMSFFFLANTHTIFLPRPKSLLKMV